MIVNLHLTFVVKLYVLLSIHQIDAIDPERKLVYDGTIFAIFSASTNSFSQVAAVDSCISWGGNLASINSQQEDAQLFSLTNTTHFQCWIGLIKHRNSILSMVNPDGYVWEDGSNGTYRKFSPINSSLQYVKFRPNNYSLNEEWDDDNTSNTNCYFCSKTANSRECDFTNNGFCYRTYQVNPAVNWTVAQSSCEDWGGNLASVTSEEENMLLFTRTPIIAFDCWVGMYTDKSGDIIWNDGNAFSYNKWRNGPSTSPPNCINWNTGGSNVWTNGNCNTDLLECYICKRILTTVSIPRVQHETLYGDSVFGYFYASWPGVTWNTALQECIGWGGSLASIESAAEDGTLYSLEAGNDTQCWIGLEISTRGSESIIWVDGSDSSYRNYSGQTPTITSIDKYYSLRSMNGGSGGEWNPLNMAETLSCFYCGKLASRRGCDFTYDGSCYRTFETNNALNWNDSQSNCMSWGGNLASITSQQENDFLFFRTPYSAINCWIGLTDVNNNGVFQWIDGEQFTYNNWDGGTPNNDSDCTQSKIDGNDEWENFSCKNLAKCHICKRETSFLRTTELLREMTINDSIFSYYTSHRAGLLVGTAQLFFCINTGGNLATIGSAEVDQLLYDLAASDDVECWIGLEKRTRGNETSIWADGSVSAYRNYPGQTSINDQITEFYSLRARNGNRTSGWEGYNPLETLSCFICQRPVNDRECEFTNDGFCYRTFLLVYPTINWFDAQSNCVMWGGNLASITSEDENTLLFLRTPYRADDCWIGLISTNMNNGAYYWIDGEMFSYDMRTSGAPNNIANTDDCARNKVTRMNEWNNYNCSSLTDSYICKRSNNAQFNPDLGDIFGELIHDNLGFKELPINTILYRNVTLICGDVTNPSSNSNNWIYSQNNDLSQNTIVDPINFNSEPGIKFISVSNSQQGFYQCRIQKQNQTTSVYTVGVFDRSVTTVAEAGRTYNYTVGIDSEDIILLCDLMDTSIDPINYRWKISDANVYINNPIIVSNFVMDSTFVCGLTTLIVRAPTLTITYQSSFNETQSQVYPNTNQFSTQGLKQDFTLRMNIEGRWRLPDGTYQTGSTITYPYLLQQYTGVYTFYLYNWDGIEVPAIQINITTNDNIGIFKSTVSGIDKWEILQNNSLVSLTEQFTTIICVGPRITSSVEWFRKDTLLRGSNGSNILDEGSIQTPGYYNCQVDEVSNYSIYVANKNILVEITDFTETLNYTLGSPTLLYHSNDSVPDNQIRWTTENIMTGDDRIFNPEYPNPVPLSIIFSDVGGGQHTFTCFYRNSPATVLGSVKFNMKDTTNVTLSYNINETTFSDINNPTFPTPQKVEILEGTVNISLKCSLSECLWKIQYNQSKMNITMHTLSLKIINLSKKDEGTYSLYRTTNSGVNYTTASIYIQVSITTGMDFENTAAQSVTIAVAVVLVIVILITLIIIIIPLMICLYILKRRRGKNEPQSKQIYKEVDNNEADPGNQNSTYYTIDDVNSKNVGTYMCLDEEIDETTFVSPAEGPSYQNINELRNLEEKIYEKIPNDPRMVPIPLDTFKAHVDKIWKKDGMLEGEYESFGGKSQRYPCTAALREENRTKNRFKLIYPYDKSRVVLKSINEDSLTDYINASHIPGVYVKNNFICSQAPKDSTLQSFWQMIIENNVANIVMVTNLVELGRTKCTAYFPLRKGKSLTIGPYDIVLVQEDVVIGYTIRTLKVSFNGRTTEIKHFHFTAWPDHDVPVLHDELLLFVEKVQEDLIESNSPILIHCSAGVGRSGTFLSLFNLSSAIKQRKSICIYNLVNEMREHRPQMVQTFAQYKFIYLSVLEMLLGNTSIPSKGFTDTYNLYMQSENEGYVSVFFQQYSELNYQCDKTFEHICKVAQNEYNESKNPITSTLPRDNNRVVLFSPHWESDYINATNFDDIECVVTINPTQNTLQDFLQLIYQTEPSLVVMLTTPKELRLIEEGTSDRVVYWPNQGEPINTDGFVLKSLLNEKSSSFLHNKINLVHKIEQVDKSFEQFISSKWNEKGEPDLESIVILLHAMLAHKQDNPAAPIIIHCTDGAGKTGVLFTVFKAILESRDKNVIDIFHIVKKLRSERMNLVPTLTHFVSCFSLMNEYCSNAL